MSGLRNRIERLEASVGGAGRVFAVRSNGANQSTVDAFVRTLGLTFDPRRDQVLHVSLRDGAPVTCHLMSALPWRK